MSLTDDSSLKAFEQSESAKPSVYRLAGDRGIYASRPLVTPRNDGRWALCDFGYAQLGSPTGRVRRCHCSTAVSLTSAQIWELFKGKPLFDERLLDGGVSSAAPVAWLIALLGPPPKESLTREFTADILPAITLEDEEGNSEGEEKAAFLRFIRRMLQWKPEDRKLAEELLEDPWLQAQNPHRLIVPSREVPGGSEAGAVSQG
ncbi:hypothetical protein W97_02081 [Coniosporium apollinis CBS 100218]|uniref:Protein kinase domain-containing protein n=1 Tax=Coniosporium apollinis (strain CBS 100218) TaxID=1168221 RepID=R7YMH1_CONA1|nr:uncharacterized protein W97_02081 [Coniosporium apollinis CBS 100218]EON62856.1 hypothetical protein W97_02081 [Coniosporium apollinis CBS 100218]